MRSSKGAAVAPLTGLIAVAILFAGVVLSSNAPDTGDGGREILDYYVANESEQIASSMLLGYGSLFLVIFAGAVRSGLRRGRGDVEGLATLAFGGGLVMAVGSMTLAGAAVVFTQNGDELDPAAAQAVSALVDGLWIIPFLVGQSVLLLASGIAILRGGALPSWLGWVAVILGVVSSTPFSLPAFLAALLWIVVVAVLLARRASHPAGDEAPPAAAAR
jgi:hypothetical protein